MNGSNIILLAQTKGYLKELQPDVDFIILCEIQKWLMDKHKIYICVAPRAVEFSYFVVKTDLKNKQPHTYGGYVAWIDAYTAAIEAAIKLLPDAG